MTPESCKMSQDVWVKAKSESVIHLMPESMVSGLGLGWRGQFFCSEEHARRYRAGHEIPDGNFYTLEQGAYFDRIAQSALFAFR